MKIDWNNVKVVKPEDLPPDAVRIHLYDSNDILRPRGSMQKESLSLHIFERLKSTYEHWTDNKYGDNPDREEVMKIIDKNLLEEASTALNMFYDYVKSKRPNLKLVGGTEFAKD